jgi:DNA invertase Pin-like site-specific DNA recombinase
MRDTAARSQELRCAIYTRKSSEEGLEQDFNSLHAQREACVAYIRSQKHEGWRAVSARYDDGGYSGGSMERPALRRLLADIKAKRIDVIVVYKVDRLTRSLADFAKIVEVFDASAVSFVSVTQAFNTTTSMGRLTLNVLLSFAQFEREVTGERIRDKIAASKKKGLWMGGFVPSGYRAKDRTLVVDPKEADTIRMIFRRYLELGSVHKLEAELEKRDLRTRGFVAQGSSNVWGDRPYSSGHLYYLLSNPIYAGKKGRRARDVVEDLLVRTHPTGQVDQEGELAAIRTVLGQFDKHCRLAATSPAFQNKAARLRQQCANLCAVDQDICCVVVPIDFDGGQVDHRAASAADAGAPFRLFFGSGSARFRQDIGLTRRGRRDGDTDHRAERDVVRIEERRDDLLAWHNDEFVPELLLDGLCPSLNGLVCDLSCGCEYQDVDIVEVRFCLRCIFFDFVERGRDGRSKTLALAIGHQRARRVGVEPPIIPPFARDKFGPLFLREDDGERLKAHAFLLLDQVIKRAIDIRPRDRHQRVPL